MSVVVRVFALSYDDGEYAAIVDRIALWLVAAACRMVFHVEAKNNQSREDHGYQTIPNHAALGTVGLNRET